MGTAQIPPQAQLSSEAEYRNMMYAQALPRLREMAKRAIHVHHKTNKTTFMLCVQVDSPLWRPLVDHLMPGHDWEAVRKETGGDPTSRGSVSWATLTHIAQRLPDIREQLLEFPKEGIMKAVVLSHFGGTVFEFELS